MLVQLVVQFADDLLCGARQSPLGQLELIEMDFPIHDKSQLLLYSLECLLGRSHRGPENLRCQRQDVIAPHTINHFGDRQRFG